jgi:hypothetical protein
MEKADTFVFVLPWGKSVHLEPGWAVGAGKRKAILLEDRVERELTYKMVNHFSANLGPLGVDGTSVMTDPPNPVHRE